MAPLDDCGQCRHCNIDRYYTSDSFELVMAWNCHHPDLGGARNPTSALRGKWTSPPGIDLRDVFDPVPAIPSWCPYRKRGS